MKTAESDVEGLARVVSGALTDAEEWVKSAEVENVVEAILTSPWFAACVQAARAEALEEAADAWPGLSKSGGNVYTWLRARAAAELIATEKASTVDVPADSTGQNVDE